jgi:mannose-6-phosphate isomerase-like protein (cupin superfamily)
MRAACTTYDRKEYQKTIQDLGPQPQSFNLEAETVQNPNYRTVAWSGRYVQLTLMSIPVGSDIGLEMHPETDQFLRLDAGRGRVQMGRTRDSLEFEQEVSDGWCILVPAGTWHNVTNIGNETDAGVCDICPCPPPARQGTGDRGRRGRRHRRRTRQLVSSTRNSNRPPRLRTAALAGGGEELRRGKLGIQRV